MSLLESVRASESHRPIRKQSLRELAHIITPLSAPPASRPRIDWGIPLLMITYIIIL